MLALYLETLDVRLRQILLKTGQKIVLYDLSVYYNLLQISPRNVQIHLAQPDNQAELELQDTQVLVLLEVLVPLKEDNNLVVFFHQDMQVEMVQLDS